MNLLPLPRPFARPRRALALILAPLLLLAACAPLQPAATSATAPPEAPACPLRAAGAESAPLYGDWTVQIDGQPAGRLQLQRHPDYPGSVSGTYTREAAPGQPPAPAARVAGDIDQGLFTLEESADGKTTSGRWSGQWSPADCANEIRGSWIDARHEQAILSPGDNSAAPARHAFTMRRAAGWQ
ncbi:MAG: hypothetical protein QM617_09595 [Comamonas sp.]